MPDLNCGEGAPLNITAANPLANFTPGTGLGGRSRVITVRPVTQTNQPTEPGGIDRTQRSQPAREPARTGTAYQTNSDGDSATFSSKLDQLSDAEQKEVTKLQARDTEVRTHEQAHVAAAGSLFRGGPYYDYKTGPDGREYAVAGRVNIDTSEGRTPEETIQKAQQIRRAALAPAEPSSTDQRVAAKAASMESQAQQELVESRDSDDTGDPSAATDRSPRADSDRKTRAASAYAAATGQLKLDTYA
ncbi:MAG: putative metalloprotease CJM1_0395 family protein [Planctomycetota bacterium]